MDIRNDTQLTQVLKTVTAEALMEAVEYIQDNLKINMWNEIYFRPSSSYYERTAQMMKSVVKPKIKITGAKIETEIGIDTETVFQMYRAGVDSFNAHMNTSTMKDPYTWRGTLVNRAVFVWYDEGTDNSYFPSVPQTNFWYDVMGSRFTDSNPNYDKAYQVFKRALIRNLGKFGNVATKL